jgi:uncharacterized SAM-binding protein YcdF (DUF218 family)
MEDSYLAGPRRSKVRVVADWLRNLLCVVGFVVVLVTVTPIVSLWAHAYAGSFELPKGDVLIVLSAASDDNDVISFSSYWRARYALLAWKTGQFKTVVISGGGGPGIRDFLIAEGIPERVILAEWQSKTTRENAVETAKLLRGVPGKRVLLTSDFHMYRAKRVFRKEGIEVSAAPAPDVLKAAEVLNGRVPGFEELVLETSKILYYRARGWI